MPRQASTMPGSPGGSCKRQRRSPLRCTARAASDNPSGALPQTAATPESSGREAGADANPSCQLPSPQGWEESAPVEVGVRPSKKYWDKRFELFSRFDDGVRMDADAWHSVTPEAIACHIARRLGAGASGGGKSRKSGDSGLLWLDAFAGVGGSAIQLALNDASGFVLAIDSDPRKVQLARHNAHIYGVASRIGFVVGDFFALAPALRAHAVHLSPPWGGVGYSNGDYTLDDLPTPGGGSKLLEVASAVAPSMALYLPRNCRRLADELAPLTKCFSSERIEVQRLLRRQGVTRWVHVHVVFGEHDPPKWLRKKSPGVHVSTVPMV